MSETLLSIRDLEVRFPAAGGRKETLTAVRGVSLEVAACSIVALVGESGSGKTSLARSVAGLVEPAGGRIRLEGQDLATLKGRSRRQARRQVQMVFQDPKASLSPRRTILQTVLEPLDHYRIGDARARRAKAIGALEQVGLDEAQAARLPSALSGGQLQRAALARAIVTGPRLVIADEPLSSLDLPVQARIIQLIRKLRSRLGIAFLLVSHDLSVVREIADSVAVMYLGEIVECGPAPDVLDRPAHPYTRALLRAVAWPDPARPPPAILEGEIPSPLTPPAGCVFHSRCPDAIGPCRTAMPAEQPVDRASGREAEDSMNNHCVRCHLWSEPEP